MFHGTVEDFTGTLVVFSQRAVPTASEAGPCYLLQFGLRCESASAP